MSSRQKFWLVTSSINTSIKIYIFFFNAKKKKCKLKNFNDNFEKYIVLQQKFIIKNCVIMRFAVLNFFFGKCVN